MSFSRQQRPMHKANEEQASAPQSPDPFAHVQDAEFEDITPKAPSESTPTK
jgi:hypothetical protein